MEIKKAVFVEPGHSADDEGVSLSATPVSKIENLQQIVENLRVCKFEVRDEEDEEVKRYTHDKNIVEVIVDKENTS